MKLKNVLFVMVGVALLATIVGCELIQTDGGTKLVPNEDADKIINTIGTGAETIGPPAAGIVTAINTVWGSIASSLLTLGISMFGAYKKWRVPLKSLTAGAKAASSAIETYVKPNTELWEKMKPELKAAESAGATPINKV